MQPVGGKEKCTRLKRGGEKCTRLAIFFSKNSNIRAKERPGPRMQRESLHETNQALRIGTLKITR